MDKPKNIAEFKKWLDSKPGMQVNNSDINYYESAIEKAREEFERGEFWANLISNLQLYNQEYYANTGYYLFISDYIPKVYVKSHNSIMSKCFRKNIIHNKSFPDPPGQDWVSPNDCFSKINDLIRTTIVVKYLDGIEFIIEKLNLLAKEYGQKFRVYYEARETGYYAVHTYLKQNIEIPKRDWDTEIILFEIEIQITTELQENIKVLTHKYYERKRDTFPEKREKWQWKYESDEFSVNYLGHILHYLEGQIMEIKIKNQDK